MRGRSSNRTSPANHSHTAADIVELGQDTERLVLARAVRMWAEDRVLLIGDRTVIFP